jgi:hypothetical protein
MTQATVTASEEIAALLGGRPFFGDVKPFTREGKLDPAAVGLFADALGRSEGSPREAVARAFVAAVIRTDPAWLQCGEVFRDPARVAVLVREGARLIEGSKEVCYDALLKYTPKALLAPHAMALIEDLERAPDSTTFLIVARLHDPRAERVVREVQERDPTWLLSNEGSAAAAAYGDILTERSAVERFVAQTDPFAFSTLALRLGCIGTPLCLRTLGEAMRTPLIQDRFPIRVSCRYHVIEGLRLTWPEAVPLFPTRFRSDADYDEAERFVTDKLGVRWTAPRPPFLFKEVQVH